jgi:hypothetical protein
VQLAAAFFPFLAALYGDTRPIPEAVSSSISPAWPHASGHRLAICRGETGRRAERQMTPETFSKLRRHAHGAIVMSLMFVL